MNNQNKTVRIKIKRVKVNIIKYYNGMLEWIFPRHCPICDEIIARKEILICRECRKKVEIISSPRCMKCGKAISNDTKEYCYDCEKKEHHFIKGRAVFSYGSVAASLYRFKYAKRAEYADFYAEEVVKHLGKEIKTWNADAMIPVPLHRSRYNARGFNQAEILAFKIGERLQIPVNCKLIKRVHKTIPQKQLNPLERQNNLKKAFKICQNDVKLKTIIVVDDIFTTGSTIDAMAIEMKKMQIEKVYFVTLAIGNGL